MAGAPHSKQWLSGKVRSVFISEHATVCRLYVLATGITRHQETVFHISVDVAVRRPVLHVQVVYNMKSVVYDIRHAYGHNH